MHIDTMKNLVGQAVGSAMCQIADPTLLGVAFVVVQVDDSLMTETVGSVAVPPGVEPELISALALEYFSKAQDKGFGEPVDVGHKGRS